MVKVLLGLAIGVLLASLVFVLLNREPGRFPVTDSSTSTAIDSPASDRTPLGDEIESPGAERAPEETRQAPTQAAAETEALEGAQAGGSIAAAIPLPPEFDWLSERREGLRALHEQIQQERREDEWAAPAEKRLQSYLYDRPEILQRYGYPTINCRATLCEVTFVGYGIEDTTSALLQNFVADMFRTPMDDLFATEFGSRVWDSNGQNGVTTVILSLRKKTD